MRRQSQLVSHERLDRHLDSTPLLGTLQLSPTRLDASGIHARSSTAILLYRKRFNYNCTFGIRTKKTEIAILGPQGFPDAVAQHKWRVNDQLIDMVLT